jgi:hypothetical protein
MADAPLYRPNPPPPLAQRRDLQDAKPKAAGAASGPEPSCSSRHKISPVPVDPVPCFVEVSLDKPPRLGDAHPQQMKRAPTEEEYRKISEAIYAGDRVGATHMYISITECGLTEAQTYIRSLTSELKSTEEEKQTAKQQKRANFWNRLISSTRD